MLITKHHQSCLICHKDDGGVIGIDLGGARPHGSYDLDRLSVLDAVIYTHRHPDHLDQSLVEPLLDRGVALYGNADVREVVGADRVTELRDGEAVTIAGWDVLPRDLPHVVMIDGSPGPPNTGVVLDGRLLHPGDGLHIDGVAVDVLAVPIAGPSISLHDAYRMVERLGPRRAIPIHYDVFPGWPERFASDCDLADVVVLGHGESVDLG